MTTAASLPRWGIVSTVKASTSEVLAFAAHHLDLGAEVVHLYLDDGDPATAARLAGHPKVHVTETTADWWATQGRRPVKHQVRQTHNANHAAAQATGLDWLAHIDVDEFLWPSRGTIAEELARLPGEALTARVLPVEALAQDPAHPTAPETCFKALDLGQGRIARASALFPRFGAALHSGFLSHTQGKVFFRPGRGLSVKIHNTFQDDLENPGQYLLEAVDLCHFHARSFDDWRRHLSYRLDQGSYRPGLRAPTAARLGGLPKHELFSLLLAEEGEDGLRAFYDEVCLATPELLERLSQAGLLRRFALDLEGALGRHFPNTPQS